MLEILAAITIVGWFMILVFLIAIFACTETDSPGFGILAFLAFLFTFIYFETGIVVTPYMAAKWVANNFLTLLSYGAVYLIIGTVWSFFKFDRYAANQRKKYDELRAERISSNSKPLPKKEDYQPEVMKSKYKFFNWIVLWWASMIWYVISDLVQDFVNFILRNFGQVYDKIAARHFKDV